MKRPSNIADHPLVCPVLYPGTNDGGPSWTWPLLHNNRVDQLVLHSGTELQCACSVLILMDLSRPDKQRTDKEGKGEQEQMAITLKKTAEAEPATSTPKATDSNLVTKLCNEAVEQNRLAKVSRGRDRRLAYQRKGQALSTLLLLGHAVVDSLLFRGCQPLVGLTLPTGDQLHVMPVQLTPDACEIVFRQIKNAWSDTLRNIPEVQCA